MSPTTGSAPTAPRPGRGRPGRIRSTAERDLRGLWTGAILAAGTFGTVAALVLLGRIETPSVWWDRILVGTGALGLLLLVRAGRETIRWLRFRNVVLEADPVEGSLGGDLGGVVAVPVRGAHEASFRVFAVCAHLDGSGDSTTRKVIWTRAVRPRVDRSANGVRLGFALALPPDLPASGDTHEWSVRVTGELRGADLDLTFPVPVARHETPLTSSRRGTPVVPPDEEDLPGRDVSVGRSAGATVLRYRTGRTAGSGLAMALFGAAFLASGGFVGRSTISGFETVFEAVFSLVGLLFLGVFGVVGVALVAFGIWRIANGLRVEATPRRIRVTRRFALLFARSREWATEEVERIEAVPVGQAGDGARAMVDYAVRGVTRGGTRIPLGDGIRGPFRMERVAAHLERATGRPVEILTQEASKTRRKRIRGPGGEVDGSRRGGS